MKTLKKNEQLIDLEDQSNWTFDCRTRGPDGSGPDSKPIATWTYVLFNQKGERRFIPESKMATLFKRPDNP